MGVRQICLRRIGLRGQKSLKTAALLRVCCAFSALTLLVGRQEGHPACKKTDCWGAGVVICLERGADLHTAQLMPLPLTVSCFSKIQFGFTLLAPIRHCTTELHTSTHTHTQPFNGLWSGTTRVGWYQKKHTSTSDLFIFPTCDGEPASRDQCTFPLESGSGSRKDEAGTLAIRSTSVVVVQEEERMLAPRSTSVVVVQEEARTLAPRSTSMVVVQERTRQGCWHPEVLVW